VFEHHQNLKNSRYEELIDTLQTCQSVPIIFSREARQILQWSFYTLTKWNLVRVYGTGWNAKSSQEKYLAVVGERPNRSQSQGTKLISWWNACIMWHLVGPCTWRFFTWKLGKSSLSSYELNRVLVCKDRIQNCVLIPVAISIAIQVELRFLTKSS